MPHLFVALSSHGFGHLAQVSPVINALCERVPGLRLSVQSDLPEWKLKTRIDWPFELIRYTPDVVFPMAGPTELLWDAAFQAYRDFHASWDERVEVQRSLFEKNRPDLLLADVPYLPLAAAEQLDIPAVAFCSLSWVDILTENIQAEAELAGPLRVMRQCYSSARWFIQPEPSIPMKWLSNRRPIGPVVAPGKDCHAVITQALGIEPNSQLVVMGLGGIPSQVAHKKWPELENVHWLVDPEDWIDRADVHNQKALDFSFRDLACSADVFITKPGYGSYTEAACCGTPVLNIAREGWAEVPYLEAWLGKSTPFETISLQQLQSGDFSDTLERLLKHSRAKGIVPDGVEQAMKIVLPMLIG
jgi:hypothetical protein